LDDLDRKIIKELQNDGRLAFKEIARKLNVSDGRVRFRTNRLIKGGKIKISASVNPFGLENSVTVLVGLNLNLEKGGHKKAMEALASLDGVIYVANVTGRFDLVIEVFMESRLQLKEFLMDELSKVKGIISTETFLFLESINRWI
jgi:DNA-binding Lrp family transcriptional regulator